MARRRTKWVLGLSVAANLLCFSAFAYLAGERGGMRDSVHLGVDPHWTERQTQFAEIQEIAPAPRWPIVFLGDSLTEYGEWNEMFGGRGAILNRGIAGDTSRGLLDRVNTIATLKPGAVFLMIGVNDFTSPGQTVRNCREILSRMRAASPATMIYLESILPVVESTPERQGLNQSILEANRRLRTLADGRRIVYVDLYRTFADGGALSRKLTVDGLHLNGEGYAQWRREILALVQLELANRAARISTQSRRRTEDSAEGF